jgi:hypothetical protein
MAFSIPRGPRLIERDLEAASSAFQVLAARMVYQYAPHQLGRNGEK